MNECTDCDTFCAKRVVSVHCHGALMDLEIGVLTLEPIPDDFGDFETLVLTTPDDHDLRAVLDQLVEIGGLHAR